MSKNLTEQLINGVKNNSQFLFFPNNQTDSKLLATPPPILIQTPPNNAKLSLTLPPQKNITFYSSPSFLFRA